MGSPTVRSSADIVSILLLTVIHTGTMGWKLDNRNIMYTNQDISYECPINTMCRCASLPNETALLEINCNEVSLYKFPEFLHGTIKHIDMSRTFIHNVDDETFQGLRLESLKLVDNKIQDISEKSFNFMQHSLVSLDLSDNQLQGLPLDSLKNVHTLSRLVAQRNNIHHLDGNWGGLADSLRSLHISGNSISEVSFYTHDEKRQNHTAPNSQASIINAKQFSQYPPVTVVGPPTAGNTGLQQQQQQQQGVKPFAKLKKLVWLDISSNRIAHISPNTFPKSLVTIDLSKNILSQFPTAFLEHLHDLRVLSLKDNLIAKLDGSPETTGTARIRLEKLDLSLNLIEELPSLLFNGSVRIKAINFDKNFIRHLEADTFQGLNIVHMVLAFNFIESIDDAAFATLENSLEYLDLERNRLTAVPSAIGRLNRLRYLYLTSNELTGIPDLPEALLPTTLKVLSLSGNNFTAIPVEGLSNCTELSYLNMGYNKIAEIEENAFAGWGSNLQTLLLRNNKITSLNYGAFNGLDTIKEISLSFNDIHYVHPNVFENVSTSLKILELSFGIYREEYPGEALAVLTELMWLGLDNNNLKTLPDGALSTLGQLTYVNLAFNRIVAIPRWLFRSDVHRNLVEIDLSFNQLEDLPSATFDSLELIQIINLSSNKLRSMQKNALHDLPYLTYVDLSYNMLQNISEGAFSFLPSLLSVDLMHNELSTLSLKVFRQVSNATTPMRLNISNNAIEFLDGDVNSLLYVYSLDASHNQLQDTTVFRALAFSLRILYLNWNNFTTLGNHAFGDLQILEILNLANNNISSLRRRSFAGLMNLQEFDLSHNRIESLQIEQFSPLKKLRLLRLNNNRLRAIPRDTFLNTRIEFLDLSHNQFVSWQATAFADIGFTLRSIQFDNNLLEFLDPYMFTSTQFLLELNLAENLIKLIPDNSFANLNNLTVLDLSHNQLMPINFRELFINVPRLRVLSLRSTGIYRLPSLALPQLATLDVSNNNLQEIESQEELFYLRELHIQENKINNISNLLRNLPPALRVLDISRNPIRKISFHDFSLSRRLEELLIEDIKIANPDIFIKLHNLKKLRISAQHNFSELVSKLRGLQELYVTIYDEHLGDGLFTSRMHANTKLNVVEITGRRLVSISSNAFQGLARNHDLKLRIHNTMVNDLPPGVFYALKYIPRLSIDLSDNLLAALAPDSFYPNASSWDAVGTRSVIGGLDVSNNPLQCECGLVWLGHWLRRWLRETAQVNLIPKDEMKQMIRRAKRSTCTDPLTGKRLPFLEIFPEDLLCHASALSSLALKLRFRFMLICLNMLLIVLHKSRTLVL
ncbi:chaoptin [Anopheles stephensi]|uniref:chaoptin n=1 Tax=Anopheles stephensi TaxID=30069 RepID=UPI0016589536|nr:chaoptin [Anopheles stephensi]XP_035913398.1 chaoptin [Anopheles stephensi]XP_035913399.1 chaoptin [Anopheles stephensi]XP_035913400.1 chaoptin [Anopheles stephensi]XP_035913402.1 chaoptin [Anopheles stephensi]XP_035913403.1 chaoptin [Anopheles stephensi]